MFKNEKVVFIGAGSMAKSILKGLLDNELLLPKQIWATNHSNDAKLHQLEENYAVHTTRDYAKLLQNATIIILAVKPKNVKESLEVIRNYVTADQLIVSVIAGVSIDFFAQHLPSGMPIIRTMPNTSAAVGQSATALARGEYASEEQMEKSRALFSAVGTVSTVKEADLHAVTGISGSGPAYLYYLAEAFEEKAIQLGLEQAVARQLITQTFIGAAQMLSMGDATPEALRLQVTSPGGTTEAGIHALKTHLFKEALHECIDAAVQKSQQLEEQYTTYKS